MPQLTMTTRTGDDRALSEETVEQLAGSLRGEVIDPSSKAYDEQCRLYNGMIDKRPGLFACCDNVADVIEAVRFVKTNDLLVSVRSGGHNGPGLALCDGGLTIDLSAMTGIRVDPEARTVRVEPGCTWGDVDHATHVFGLATVSGIFSTTGVGGLTLGGGHGYLTRKHGLTIDNLVAADVVLPDGTFVTASEREHPDLFWALRGGGGNFGVVTSFVYRLHPVSEVLCGPTFWPLEKTAEVLRWYRDFLPNAPEDLYGFFGVMRVPPAPPFPEKLHGEPVCGAVWCATGPGEEAERMLAPVKAFGPPLFDGIGRVPYPALQSMFDALYPPGLQWYWKGHFIREITGEAIEQHVKHAEVPTPHSTMHLYPIDGAAKRVGPDETPWGHRDATWSMVIAGVDPEPENAAKIETWARDYWEAIRPHGTGAGYVNFMMEEGDERVRATYGETNYERLAKIKKAYDPENRFRVNQNIPPAD